MKKCELCSKEIPEDYTNLLCMDCYNFLPGKPEAPIEDPIETSETGILDSEYQENEEVEELDLISRCHGRFKGTGVVMPVAQRKMYESIRDFLRDEYVLKNIQRPKFIWKPTIVDVGCGIGIGTNILSHEADYALGLDKNEESIRYASQMFARHKNNIYWSPQVDFSVSDVIKENREMMKFDVVTCIEVFEHLKETKPLLKFLKTLVKPKGYIFISTPNRSAWEGTERAQKPLNKYHVRELTAKEFQAFLVDFYQTQDVILLDKELEPLTTETKATPIIARIKI